MSECHSIKSLARCAKIVIKTKDPRIRWIQLFSRVEGRFVLSYVYASNRRRFAGSFSCAIFLISVPLWSSNRNVLKFARILHDVNFFSWCIAWRRRREDFSCLFSQEPKPSHTLFSRDGYNAVCLDIRDNARTRNSLRQKLHACIAYENLPYGAVLVKPKQNALKR